MFNEPGRSNAGTRDETAGTQHRGSCAAGAGVGAALNIMAIVSGDARASRNHRRAGTSTVSFGGPSRQQCRTKRNPVSRGRSSVDTSNYSIRAACERSEILSSRVSDVSATGTERSVGVGDGVAAVESVTAELYRGAVASAVRSGVQWS